MRRALACVVFVAAGCTTGASRYPGDETVREVARAPLAVSGAVSSDGSSACQTPLVIPSARVTLTLERSYGGRGDYRTNPADAWGLRVTELLRVDCRTGRVMGAVPA
jgi:hypothetical protein